MVYESREKSVSPQALAADQQIFTKMRFTRALTVIF